MLKRKLMLKRLEIFLRKNKCLKAFKKNLLYFYPGEQYKGSKGYKGFKQDYKNNESVGKDLISAAFIWNKTEEGYDYWLHVRNNWMDYVKKYKL